MRPLAAVLSASALLFALPASADGDLSRADPVEIVIEMGTAEGAENRMYFEPSHIELETGKAYKIVLKNVDEIKHEFESHELVEKIFTRKVEITDDAGGLVAEIKGNVREIEVGPGKQAEWYIVPVQTGEDLEMSCEIEGHREAGMVGTVTIR